MSTAQTSSLTLLDHYPAESIRMGHLPVMQPFPLARLEQLSPFLLLHHFGPRKVLPGVDPLGVEAHPHRGFEPVTFPFQGEIQHRDSRGNEGLLQPGGVQWMTAGLGIVHSEKASKKFVEQGGTLEGIQLWVNVPAANKMGQPAYQDFSAQDLTALSGEDWRMAVVSGGVRVRSGQDAWQEAKGPARTFTPVTTAMVHAEPGATLSIDVPAGQQAGFYLLDGSLDLADGTRASKFDFLRFSAEGGEVTFTVTETLRGLWLAGEPIDEPMVSHGPFVMNTSTEIMEAMRDYQMGKMGMLVPS